MPRAESHLEVKAEEIKRSLFEGVPFLVSHQRDKVFPKDGLDDVVEG